MIPWEHLDSAVAPDGSAITLHRRGDELEIRANGRELMNSRLHGSEDALAELACHKMRPRQEPTILIGGLGMGYTLAAALTHANDHTRVVVAELIPQVVDWNQQYLGHLAGQPLDNPRVQVRTEDVAGAIREGQKTYDAILLDTDNGPEAMTTDDNDWLYSRTGLKEAYSALVPGGVLAVWSATPEPLFTRRLRKTGFVVEEARVRAHRKKRGARHTIWLAQRNP